MNLLWFRNDIRLDDNPALSFVLQQKLEHGIDFKAVFIATPQQWEIHHRAPIQIDFLERHVRALAEQLAKYGIEFHCFDFGDFKQTPSQLLAFCQEQRISHVVVNQELEINEVIRDQTCSELLQANSVNWQSFESDVVVPKGELLNGTGGMYKVYTPFKKAWAARVQNTGIGLSPTHALLNQLPANQDVAPASVDFSSDKRDSSDWPLMPEVWREQWPNFAEKIIDDYGDDRDFPSLPATSKLSPHLAIGAVSAKRLLANIVNTSPDVLERDDHPKRPWVNQIIWRDFYRHLLFHCPDLAKGKSFLEKYQHMNWPNSPELFEKWCEGKTGYPIVDAAMRQLNQTGWMHNRLRMVVASFLTKHLLIDWRHGERYFAEHLIDIDLANNNGGWQWAASTGCDAQPYFRIFNPISQSEKFDPDGTFLRKYLPELDRIPIKHIHFPHEYIGKNGIQGYWPAIVEHKTARLNALEFYKAIN